MLLPSFLLALSVIGCQGMLEMSILDLGFVKDIGEVVIARCGVMSVPDGGRVLRINIIKQANNAGEPIATVPEESANDTHIGHPAGFVEGTIDCTPDHEDHEDELGEHNGCRVEEFAFIDSTIFNDSGEDIERIICSVVYESPEGMFSVESYTANTTSFGDIEFF